MALFVVKHVSVSLPVPPNSAQRLCAGGLSVRKLQDRTSCPSFMADDKMMLTCLIMAEEAVPCETRMHFCQLAPQFVYWHIKSICRR